MTIRPDPSIEFGTTLAATPPGLVQERTADEHVDLVITDLGLPDMSGVTLVRLLRRLNEQLRHVPIIMLTASDGNEYQRSAIHGGYTERSYCISAHAPIEKWAEARAKGLFPDPR